MRRMEQSRGGGWSRSWLALGAAVVVLALSACGGGGGAGDGAPQEPVAVPVILGQPGPGDAGNHLPFTVGNVWHFQGTLTETGLPPKTFVNTATITGTRQVGGVTVTVFQDSNPDDSGVPEEAFLVKDLNGIADFGNSDPTDTLTPQLVPFWEVRFPLETGSSFVQLDRKGHDLGDDLDGDGINDLFDLRVVVKMAGFEQVTVPVGTFADCAKIEQNVEIVFLMSSDNSRVASTGVLTLWFSPNVGWVKRMAVTTIPSRGFAETVTEELIGFEVDGQAGQITIQTDPSAVTIPSGGLTQLSATAFNPVGAPVSVIPVTWISSNPAVASVDANGQVLGFAIGAATITASLGNIVSNPVTVTVGAVSQPPPQQQLTTIQVLPSPVSVATGGTVQLAATGRDQSNSTIVGLAFTWQSANSAVASVDANGLVSGVAPGTTTVTASAGEISSPPVIVTVSNSRQIALATNDLVFDPLTLKIYASVPSRAGVNGNSVAIINPETGQVESFIPVGSEPKKLALSDDGRFLYVALDGTGSIARLDFNNPAAPVLDLTFPLGSDSFFGPFFVEDMEVTYSDSITQNLTGSVTWSSSDTSKATISNAGLASAVAAGTTTIKAMSGSISGTTTLTVTALINSDHHLWGGAGLTIYLGCLTCGNFDSDSVCNQYGTYGSTYSSSSIWNEYGTYGSPYNSYSPWNAYSSSGPGIFSTDGLTFYGYFTVNVYKTNRTQNTIYLDVLSYYANTQNLSLTRTYACGN